MAISVSSFVTLANGGNSASSIVPPSSNVATGNTVVCCFGLAGTPSVAISSVTDGTNSYTAGTKYHLSSGDNRWIQFWYAKNVAGNSALVPTANLSGASTFRIGYVWNIAGASASAPYENDFGSQALSGTSTVTGINTSHAGDLILMAMIGNGYANQTGGSGFTFRTTGPTDGTGNYGGAQDQVISGTLSGATESFGTPSASPGYSAAVAVITGGGGGPVTNPAIQTIFMGW